jgi:hypothetical protein
MYRIVVLGGVVVIVLDIRPKDPAVDVEFKGL